MWSAFENLSSTMNENPNIQENNTRRSRKPRVGFFLYISDFFALLATPVLVGFLFFAMYQSLILLTFPNTFQLKMNLVLQIVVFLIFAYWSYKRAGTYVSAPVLFVFSIWFWHSPFLTGHFLGVGGIFDYTGTIFSYGYSFVSKATALVALCLCFAILGTICGYIQQKKKVKRDRLPSRDNFRLGSVQSDILLNKGFSKLYIEFAWLSFLGFVSISLIYFILEGVRTFGNTYISLYTEHSSSHLYLFFQSVKFYGVVVILALFSAVQTKKSFLVAVFITVGLIFINILMGSRSMPFIYTAALLLSIDYRYQRIALWKVILFSIMATALSFVIDQTRGYGVGFEIFNFGKTERSIDFLHIFWNCGGTIQCVLRTMEFSLESGLILGQSIADAVIYLIPRAIVDGIGLNTGVIPPSEWLIEKSGDVPIGGGLGYSFIAEAYLNFGMFGCLLFALIGWYIAKNAYSYVFHGNRFGVLHALNVAIIMSLHMRSDLGTYLRALVYGYIFIEILRFVQAKKLVLNVLDTATKDDCKNTRYVQVLKKHK